MPNLQSYSVLSLIIAILLTPATHSGEPSKARWVTLKELEKTIEETNVITVRALLPLISEYAASKKFFRTLRGLTSLIYITKKDSYYTTLDLHPDEKAIVDGCFVKTPLLGSGIYSEIEHPSKHKLTRVFNRGEWTIIIEKEGKEIASMPAGTNHEIRRSDGAKLYKNNIVFIDMGTKLKAKNFLKKDSKPKLLLEHPDEDEPISDFFISPCNKIIVTLGFTSLHTRSLYRWEHTHEITEEYGRDKNKRFINAYKRLCCIK